MSLRAFALLSVACILATAAPQAGAVDRPDPRQTPAQEISEARHDGPVVIDSEWRLRYPFSKRFAQRPADGDGTLMIDLAATRFPTRALRQITGGRVSFLAPDLGSFARELVRDPFTLQDPDYIILQAEGPAAQSKLRELLDREGVPILAYIPQFAYLVRADRQAYERLVTSDAVFWAGYFHPAFRIAPKLDLMIHTDASRGLGLRVILDRATHADEASMMNALRALEIEVEDVSRRSDAWSVRLRGAAVIARSLALVPGCLWVERWAPFELHNNVARTSAATTTGRGAEAGPVMDVEDVWARGIRGEGQIAAASDTGLSTGNLATLHLDYGQQGASTNPMRVIKGYALGRATWDDNQTTGGGHGTHTSGSIVGNGIRSGSTPSTNTFPASSYAGTAPKAEFVFQSLLDSLGYLGGIPADLNDLFAPPYGDGARVHSNSWGAAVAGEYNADSRDVDEFVWNNDDMVITFSAGNSGIDGKYWEYHRILGWRCRGSGQDGIIDTDSIGAPGTAKNCITVGASENYRPGFVYEYPEGDCTGTGFTQQAWGWFDGCSFSAAPIYSDLMADDAGGMGAFSSRGPTDDGRIKPDLTAPGIAIISTRTDVNQAYEQWGICNIPSGLRSYYLTMGGTSMANPLTAGTAVLVRQYYADGWHDNGSLLTNQTGIPADAFNPSAALVKATLINGAWDISPGQYGTGGTREIPPGWDSPRDLPNNVEGWGRVDLEHSLFPGAGWGDDPDRAMLVHDVRPGLGTGGADGYVFDVLSGADPLIVTLVWTDPWASTGAGAKLVNDLDLVVTSPTATRYWPNRRDWTGGSADRTNNVEQVVVSAPESGQWVIEIEGYNIPGNGQGGTTTQPYALVVSGVSCTAVAPAGLSAAANGDNRIDLSWGVATGATEYRVYRATTSGGPYTQIATITAPTTTHSDTTVHGGITYYYVVTTYTSCESPYSAEESATATGPCGLAPDFDGVSSVTPNASSECALDVAWSAATPLCGGPVTYSVHRSTSSGFAPDASNRIATGLTGTAYTDASGLASGTTYYYVVRATDESNGQEDANTVEASGSTSGACASTPGDVLFFTGRATSTQVKLEWVNPPAPYALTRICSSSVAYPSDPASCAVVADRAGAAGAYDVYTDTGPDNAKTYYYTAFVKNGAGVYSAGRRVWARPFATGGKVKWAYSSAASALAPTGVRPGAIGTGGTWAVANDRLLHGMNPTAAGGDWPRTAPFAWTPMAMNGPAQARPPVVPTTAVAGADQVIFLGSEDGRVYAVDAETGQSLWRSPALAGMLLAAPSGIFTDFGGAHNALFIGTRDATADNRMYALDPADGSVVTSFDNGGGAAGIGIISSSAAVDYAVNRIYFASRARAGGSNHTLWCVSFDGSNLAKVWSVPLGDIDGGPVLYQGRLYVGNNAGVVYAVNPADGATVWSYATGGGAVKGHITPEAAPTLPRRLYLSTTGTVWAIDDVGASASLGWQQGGVAGPSVPLVPFGGAVLYVGSAGGSLYQLAVGSGAVQASVVLGDGSAAVGSPSLDVVNNMAYVGTEAGAVYGVELPLQ